MSDQQESGPGVDLPVLTDIVDEQSSVSHPEKNYDALVAELQTELAASTMELAERLLLGALRGIEAALFEQVSNHLRQQLPELIDRTLRDHLNDGRTDQERPQ
jgi:uncharacterized protein (DUF2267 family)